MRTREEHHAAMIGTLSQFLEIAKDDKSTITCGVLAVMTEFLGHFQTGLEKTCDGMADNATIDVPGIIGCQLTALNRCIASLQGAISKMIDDGERH